MQLNPEILESIEKAAYKGFEVKQVAHLIGMPAAEFEMLFLEDSHPVVLAYLKGIYQCQSDLREAIVNSALSGSSPAQHELKKHLDAAIVSLKISMGE